MKIGIIAHLKHPVKQPFAGGLEVFTFEITRRLQQRGHDVILFASASSDKDLPLISILSDKYYDNKTGARQKVKDMSSEYVAEHHAYYRLMLTMDDYNFDIVFNNSLHYIPITMANMIQTPMVTVLHTPPFYELNLAIRAEQKQPCNNYYTVSNTNANSWKNALQECGVVYNGIDLSRWIFYCDTLQEDYVVWFGRIHPDKGLEYAIKAAKIANIPLKIAGGIGDKSYYLNKIEPLLNDHVQMLGLLSHNELNALIGKAKVCLVTPVWQEPFGLVVVEAMACGTPIAGFEMGALPEIINSKVGCLVPFGDVEELSKAILEAKKLNRKKVRQYCEDNFHIEKMIDQYEEILQNHIDSFVQFKHKGFVNTLDL